MTTTQLESMEVQAPATLVAQIEGITAAPAELGAEIGKAFGRLFASIGQAGVTCIGAPRATYTAWGPDAVQFTVAAPIDRRPVEPMPANGATIAELPARTALRFVHRGPYRDIRATYEQIEAWLRERGGFKTAADWARYSPMWEEYLNDPSTTPESELLTHIFLPLPAS
jgi:AraC family transcriptional regulator